MDENNLFRPEVFESTRNRNYGSVLVNIPASYTVLISAFSGLVGLILLFLLLGEFSEKFIVKGYLESTKGIVPIYPNKNGVIEKCYIQQGDNVKKGDKLCLINTSDEHLSKNYQYGVLSQLEKKKTSLESELRYKKRHLQRLKTLLIKKYIPVSTYHAKHDELILIKNQINGVDIEIINYKHNKSYVICSPIDGVISSVIYQQGQHTNLTKPLMKILPSHAELMALLFIPIPKSGFLQRNTNVIIHYDAYPHARFGTSKASIQQISGTILTDNEEEKPIRIGEPYYKVSALLDKQFITVYGKDKKIQHGMTVSAVIVGSKKRIWQWILDPIYSFYGGVFV
jgi:membrane fusion protein